VVPAAGVGRRMGGGLPKQYRELRGRRVIEHSLARLLAHPGIAGVYVALSPEDGWWPGTEFAGHPAVHRVPGGRERCHSVLNALEALAEQACDADWVLVHDAARPCLRRADLDRLFALEDHPVGGLLGVPVRDTIKKADEAGAILRTVAREHLWHAFTPQMFRLGALRRALRETSRQGLLVTDDASAMEFMGWQPQLVEGHADNIKITRPEDLLLAGFYLERQELTC
jgi:2-C-methyl-D-erythritol 4-phosphate cytidylyltransferase